MTYTIKKLATLAGVSVRTLHYYDEIGLLHPYSVQKNGYRIYGEQELMRLQQILFFRELEFPLDDIKRMLNAPTFNPKEALEDQKRLIQLKKRRLDKLIKTINKTIQHMEKEERLTNEEMYDVFKDDDVKQYQDEVKKRWGNTDAYAQSMKRVKNMTQAEMKKLKEDGKKFTQQLADAMDKNSTDPEVQALIQQHYNGIQFFYDCSLDMYRQLGQMYVDDPRFMAYYEKFRPGLAIFLRDAIAYYCDQR